MNDAIDPVPGQPEICVADENLALQLAAGGRQTVIGKVWVKTDFRGSSALITVPSDSEGGDGCFDGDRFGVRSLGAFNNDIASARGYSGCSTLKFFNYKNYGGSSFTCNSPCNTLGAFNNKPSSAKISP